MTIAVDVARWLRLGRYRLGYEALLQEDVRDRLTAGGFPFKREFVLGPGERVDFLVNESIAVELKIRAAKRVIYRQMQRYAAHERVDSLILVTACATGLPGTLNGKPVYVVSLGLTGL